MPREQRPPSSSPHQGRFTGFTSPNTTSVPDQLFDELMVELSGAELKTLLYIIRRTFGFKREADAISLSQMLHGLRARDGRQLDRGVGVDKKTLLRALTSLQERGIVHTEHRRSSERGDEPTIYRLHVLGPDRRGETPPPVGEKFPLPPGGIIPPPPWGKNSPTQQTVKRHTEDQQQGALAPSRPDADAKPRGSDVVDSGSLRERNEVASSQESAQLVAELTSRGVGKSSAALLVRDVRPELIREKLALFDWAKQHRPTLITRSDGGFLRMAVTTNYPLPADFLKHQSGGAERRRVEAERAEEERRRVEAERAEEERRRVEEKAADLARDPAEVAVAYAQNWDKTRRALKQPPMTEAEWEAEVERKTGERRRDQAEFFAQHPQLWPHPDRPVPVAEEPQTAVSAPHEAVKNGQMEPVGRLVQDRVAVLILPLSSASHESEDRLDSSVTPAPNRQRVRVQKAYSS